MDWMNFLLPSKTSILKKAPIFSQEQDLSVFMYCIEDVIPCSLQKENKRFSIDFNTRFITSSTELLTFLSALLDNIWWDVEKMRLIQLICDPKKSKSDYLSLPLWLTFDDSFLLCVKAEYCWYAEHYPYCSAKQLQDGLEEMLSKGMSKPWQTIEFYSSSRFQKEELEKKRFKERIRRAGKYIRNMEQKRRRSLESLHYW